MMAQKMSYIVNLDDDQKDKLPIRVSVDQMNADEIIYYFPKTIPGTYSVMDYGKYIKKFKAFDAEGNKLKVKKVDKNSFRISKAKSLHTIEYIVQDTWDKKVLKNKIFEPAGTGFEKDEYYALNLGGLMGCIEGNEQSEINLNFKSSKFKEGITSLKHLGNNKYIAESYHELIDCPILFSSKPSTSFKIGNCMVNIANYNAESDSVSYHVKNNLEESFDAIYQFTGKLPVEEYNLLLFIADLTKYSPIIHGDKASFFKKVGLIANFVAKHGIGAGFGALEHGTSSFYYLADFGKNDYLSSINDVAIHEFMHIYTPLNLHSTLIGDFNYRDPKMSKHLWLYEGVTEYFSHLIQIQSGLKPENNLFLTYLPSTIRSAARYDDSIPFATMSEKVFKKPYKNHYGQVYIRGALMGMILDSEIIRLTRGEKTLKDIIFQLAEKYGKNKSFKEEDIIPEIVSMVHPDLQNYFNDYVLGTKPLDYKKHFATIGIEFNEFKGGKKLQKSPYRQYRMNLEYTNSIDSVVIMGLSNKEESNFKKGDVIFYQDLLKTFYKKDGKTPLEKGEIAEFPVVRDGKKIKVSFPIELANRRTSYIIRKFDNPTEDQKKYYKIWSKQDY
jgi:predicted metalloprotease with PDZ domain